MSELSARARGLAKVAIYAADFEEESELFVRVLAAAEQALLAERRLAMESLSKYLRHVGSCRFTFDGQRDSCTCGLLEAAAEKEVGK